MRGAQQTSGGVAVPVLGHHLLVPPHLAAEYGYLLHAGFSLYVLFTAWSTSCSHLNQIPLLSEKVALIAPILYKPVPGLLHSKEVMATVLPCSLFQSSYVVSVVF